MRFATNRNLSQPKGFFSDSDGIFYRRRSNGNHHVVVPATLVQVMKENHTPVYIAHPGTKRMHDLITLRYWWPGM
jgi:hypothetical protein